MMLDRAMRSFAALQSVRSASPISYYMEGFAEYRDATATPMEGVSPNVRPRIMVEGYVDALTATMKRCHNVGEFSQLIEWLDIMRDTLHRTEALGWPSPRQQDEFSNSDVPFTAYGISDSYVSYGSLPDQHPERQPRNLKGHWPVTSPNAAVHDDSYRIRTPLAFTEELLKGACRVSYMRVMNSLQKGWEQMVDVINEEFEPIMKHRISNNITDQPIPMTLIVFWNGRDLLKAHTNVSDCCIAPKKLSPLKQYVGPNEDNRGHPDQHEQDDRQWAIVEASVQRFCEIATHFEAVAVVGAGSAGSWGIQETQRLISDAEGARNYVTPFGTCVTAVYARLTS